MNTQKLLTLITLIICCQTLAAATQSHFRHLKFRETPFSAYEGIHPISKQQAKNTAHYRFTHDDAGRLIEVAHMLGNHLIPNNGNWDTFIWFAPKVTIAYAKDQEIHRYYDLEDQRLTAHGGIYTATYTLNDQGQRVALHHHNEAGEPSESAWNIHRYQWQHTGPGQLIETRYNLAGEQQTIRPEFQFYETHMTFDALGQIQRLVNYGTNATPSNNESGAGIDRIFYDLAGNFQRWHVYDKDGNPVNGNGPMVHIGEHLYDHHGNKIGMRGFDTEGMPKAFSWGDFEQRKEYSPNGNQTAAITLSPDLSVISRIELSYSQDGLRREWLKHFNAEGELTPSPALQGAAAVSYTYEKGKGLPTKHTLLDQNLKPIETSE